MLLYVKGLSGDTILLGDLKETDTLDKLFRTIEHEFQINRRQHQYKVLKSSESSESSELTRLDRSTTLEDAQLKDGDWLALLIQVDTPQEYFRKFYDSLLTGSDADFEELLPRLREMVLLGDDITFTIDHKETNPLSATLNINDDHNKFEKVWAELQPIDFSKPNPILKMFDKTIQLERPGSRKYDYLLSKIEKSRELDPVRLFYYLNTVNVHSNHVRSILNIRNTPNTREYINISHHENKWWYNQAKRSQWYTILFMFFMFLFNFAGCFLVSFFGFKDKTTRSQEENDRNELLMKIGLGLIGLGYLIFLCYAVPLLLKNFRMHFMDVFPQLFWMLVVSGANLTIGWFTR